jgi:Tfp pilus assembly PilM family ATPase
MPRYLALDWDQNQLHVIAANVSGSSVRVQRAAVWAEGDASCSQNAEELGKALRERLKSAGIAPAPVLACVGRDRVIVKDVRFPAVPESEEPNLVRFQAVKELTDAGEDVVIDYIVVDRPEGAEQKALALVLRRDVLQAFQTLCSAAGLRLAALMPRPVGVAACLRKIMGTTVVTPPPEPADAAVAVVVVGERGAEFSVFRGERLLLARAMTCSPHLASEVRRNLTVYDGQNRQNPVAAVYVSGKGSGELRQALADLIEQPVHTFDPFAGSEALDLPAGNRGTFAGAMGLLVERATADRERRPLTINFVEPRQAKPPVNPNYRLIRMGLVAGFVLLVGLLGVGRMVLASDEGKLAALEQANKEIDARLKTTQENAKRIRAIDDWDNPVWLDEMYELAARIKDVNKLRITSLTAGPLPRTTQSRYGAKMDIKGVLLDRSNPWGALDDLVAQLTREGYGATVSKREGRQFNLIVNVARRAPTQYTRAVDLERLKAAFKAAGGKAGQGGDKMDFRGKGKGKGKGKRQD